MVNLDLPFSRYPPERRMGGGGLWCPSRLSFSHNMLLSISSIVEKKRGNLDVQVNSVLIEQDSTTSIMGHIEMTRQVLVLEVLNCLLQSDDGPLPCNVLLDGFFSSSGSWIPVVDAEPLLFGRSLGHVAVKMILLACWSASRNAGLAPSNVTPKSDLGGPSSPVPKNHPVTRQDLFVKIRQS